jgi:hypothetical protein
MKLPSVADVEGRLDHIASTRANLVGTRTSLLARVDAVRRDVGTRYLQGDRSGIQESAEIEAELGAIESALEVLDGEEAGAKVDLERAKVRELRATAEQKRLELEKLEAKTGKLLLQLSDLEDVTFTHSILSSQPLPGVWLRHTDLKEPFEWEAIAELVPNNYAPAGKVAVPLSRRLRREVQESLAQADEIEARLLAESAPKVEPAQTQNGAA